MMKKALGLTLLETLLVLAIGASIIMVGVRYFAVTTRDLHVTHAIKQIQTLTRVSYEWLQAQKQKDFSSSDGGTTISMQNLIGAGLLENTDSDTKDPWGKAIMVTPGSNPSHVKITLPNVPKKDCKNLARRLQSVSQTILPTCSSNRNNYSGEF